MAKKQSSSTKTRKFSAELKDRLPILKFIAAFILFTIMFYLMTTADWFESIRQPLIRVYTYMSSIVLNIFGMNTSSDGSVLSSARFSVNVKEGCDAVAPTLLFVTAVLVFPVAWRHKFKGLLYGIPALTVLNLIRIISLFLIGIYAPALFDFMHVEFWQAVFILLTVLLFIYWLRNAKTFENEAK